MYYSIATSIYLILNYKFLYRIWSMSSFSNPRNFVTQRIYTPRVFFRKTKRSVSHTDWPCHKSSHFLKVRERRVQLDKCSLPRRAIPTDLKYHRKTPSSSRVVSSLQLVLRTHTHILYSSDRSAIYILLRWRPPVAMFVAVPRFACGSCIF